MPGKIAMPRNNRRQEERVRKREDALRPSPNLGYSQDHLGVYFLRRGVLKTAEAYFRRAIYLNPYEPLFLANLATCLFEMGQLEEARKLATMVVKAGRLEAVDELLKLLEKSFQEKYQEQTEGE
jgi:Flp pilus assembly protein TadD